MLAWLISNRIVQLRQRPGDEDHEAVLRIGGEPEDSNLLVPFAQRERVDGLSAREVDDLEVLLIGVLDVQPRAVGRQAH